MSSAKHVHLIGICGTAMASLAGMLRAQGHRVTGSDTAAYPPMSDQLRAMGIPIMEPYAAKNLEPRPDLVVVGNAISRGNRRARGCARRAHPDDLDGRAHPRRIPAGPRALRRLRHARQNHNHQHAGVDLRDGLAHEER